MATIYKKCNQWRASPRGTHQRLSTDTTLYSEVRQGQFSWHLNLEVLWSVFREVNGSGEAEPIGELDIFIHILQANIEIYVT